MNGAAQTPFQRISIWTINVDRLLHKTSAQRFVSRKTPDFDQDHDQEWIYARFTESYQKTPSLSEPRLLFWIVLPCKSNWNIIGRLQDQTQRTPSIFLSLNAQGPMYRSQDCFMLRKIDRMFYLNPLWNVQCPTQIQHLHRFSFPIRRKLTSISSKKLRLKSFPLS